MATLSNTDLRRGIVFEDGGNIYIVLEYASVVRGRGSSIVKVKVKNVENGGVQELTYRENEKVQSADMRRKTMQFLYTDTKNGFFMDLETYEQLQIPLDLIDEELKYLKESEKVIVLFVNEKAVSIEISKAVELEVTYTEPGVKGDTATNAFKDATLENGLVVKVPLFINIGDKIKVNTETGEYSSRA